MATTYSNAQYIGEAFAEVFKDVMLENNTVANEVVTVDTDVKGNKPYTESVSVAGIQAYKATPTSGDTAGSTTFTDLLAVPQYFYDYDRFDPQTFTQTRWVKDAKPGAYNMVSDQFILEIIASRAPKISTGAEALFWCGAKSASKTAVAALTPGTGQNAVGSAEQTAFAALTTTLFDGVIARLILSYSNSSTRRRYKVVGTTITSSNIDTEYGKLYAAITSAYQGSALLAANNVKNTKIVAPLSHMALINIFNINQTYRDKFTVVNGEYFFLGIKIEFCPIPENVMILARTKNFIWATDLINDVAGMKIDYVANDSKEMFMRTDFTLDAVVMQPGQVVLYVG